MPMSPKCKFRISPAKRISLSYPWPNYDLYLFVNVLQKLCKVSLPTYVVDIWRVMISQKKNFIQLLLIISLQHKITLL